MIGVAEPLRGAAEREASKFLEEQKETKERISGEQERPKEEQKGKVKKNVSF